MGCAGGPNWRSARLGRHFCRFSSSIGIELRNDSIGAPFRSRRGVHGPLVQTSSQKSTPPGETLDAPAGPIECLPECVGIGL